MTKIYIADELHFGLFRLLSILKPSESKRWKSLWREIMMLDNAGPRNPYYSWSDDLDLKNKYI